ncbi:hypothetical protein LBMAG42_05870 [Deltaproteobacteria bacterium]|nr:hypothetical protein LBMAG42_05870 [Deltaproteobacteria bacterium]
MSVQLSRPKWFAVGLLLWVLLACNAWVRPSAPPGVGATASQPLGVLSRAPSASDQAVRRLNEGRTALRFVDEGGNPVAGVPVYEHEDPQGAVYPWQVGAADSDGIYHPEHFPITLGVNGWPATPESLRVEDDGREHVMTVARACDVALSWDLPPGPNPYAFDMPGAESVPVAQGSAHLHVPCGVLSVELRERTDEPARAVELVEAHFDSREPTAHLEWKSRSGITVCVEDEEGVRIPDAKVQGMLDAWPRGDCWGVDPFPACVDFEAGGFLTGELCPEDGFTWQRTRYDIALERAREVHFTCDVGGESAACTEEQVRGARCVSAATPDFGACDLEAQTCACPDAPDAQLLCADWGVRGGAGSDPRWKG